MTDTLNLDNITDQDNEEIEPALHAIELTRNQKIATAIFGVFALITIAGTLAYTFQATNAVNAVTHAFWVHLMSK